MLYSFKDVGSYHILSFFSVSEKFCLVKKKICRLTIICFFLLRHKKKESLAPYCTIYHWSYVYIYCIYICFSSFFDFFFVRNKKKCFLTRQKKYNIFCHTFIMKIDGWTLLWYVWFFIKKNNFTYLSLILDEFGLLFTSSIW